MIDDPVTSFVSYRRTDMADARALQHKSQGRSPPQSFAKRA